jgi:hypothetical protein
MENAIYIVHKLCPVGKGTRMHPAKMESNINRLVYESPVEVAMH